MVVPFLSRYFFIVRAGTTVLWYTIPIRKQEKGCGDGKHYCAVSFESKLAREAFCELNGYEPVLVKWAIDNLAGSVYNDIRHYPNIIVDNSLRKPIGFVLEDGSIS